MILNGTETVAMRDILDSLSIYYAGGESNGKPYHGIFATRRNEFIEDFAAYLANTCSTLFGNLSPKYKYYCLDNARFKDPNNAALCF